MASPASPAPRHRGDRLIELIGAFKLVKAALLIAGSVGALYALDPDVRHWLQTIAADADRARITRWIAKAGALDPVRLRELGFGGLFYAGLFLVEGIGLLRRRRWAEWMTIIITGSFVPLEVYELVEGRSVVKALVLVANLAIVAYLVARRMRDRREHQRREHFTNVPADSTSKIADSVG
jgi:uncharacterized membrane protein (DUF2068 family)